MKTKTMKTGIIYLITNKINCKVYVGQTIQHLEARWRSHKGHATSGKLDHLYCAMRSYGINNFSIEIIETLPVEQLDLAEIRWIAYYVSDDPKRGFNKTKGGGGIRGYRHTERARKSMTLKRTGKPMPPRTPEHTAKIVAKTTGRKRRQEEKDQISATMKSIDRHPNSLLALVNNRPDNTGRRHTDEAKKAIGSYWKGRKRGPRSEESRAKQRETRTRKRLAALATAA